MDEHFSKVKAELVELGFHHLDEKKVTGRIPQHGEINGFYIEVEINLKGFPIDQPSIILRKICDRNNIYKELPKEWRHIDEFLDGMSPKTSSFHICCLHNWRAKREFNGEFIYNRILSWLESNVEGQWNVDEDLPSYRIIPQFSNCKIFLTKDFLDNIGAIKVNTIYNFPVTHSFYKLTNGDTVWKMGGNQYSFNHIDFSFSNVYTYLPELKGSLYSDIQFFHSNKEWMHSQFLALRLPSRIKFKSVFQLTEYIRCNFDRKRFPKEYKNFPILIYYFGDKGRQEAISLIIGEEFFRPFQDYQLKVIQIQTLPSRPLGIDLNVGLLGTGSLGSQVARILTDKGTKKLIMHDWDILSAENLGHHELFPHALGLNKSEQLKMQLSLRSFNTEFSDNSISSDEEVAQAADILVVTVGSAKSFDQLAFRTLLNYDKPIVWAWTSPNNILQEIVITTPNTGCLNCYYMKTETDHQLKKLFDIAKQEIMKEVEVDIDLCGNPHTISRWERMVFLGSQIVSILAYYSKHKKFRFDYAIYYCGFDEIIPTSRVGFLAQQDSCFCKGAQL